MKNCMTSFLLVVFLFSLISCKQKTEGYTIDGTFIGSADTWILLKKRDQGKYITVDSVQVKDGKFAFTGKVDMPEMFYLKIGDQQGKFPLFIENSPMTLKVNADSLDKTVVTGSATHETYQAYLKDISGYEKQQQEIWDKIMQAREKKDSISEDQLGKEYDKVDSAQNVFTKNYILKNGKTVVAPYLALSNAWAFSLEDLKTINKAMDASISESNYVKKLIERQATLEKVQVGMPAPDFSMNDTAGKPVMLSSLKGKIVLVDFWASWCGPCRHENPNVVKAFKKYGNKGFTVLGVSLDKEKDKWLAAIAKDGLTWTHVSDLVGWDNAAAAQYGVMSIPANFLLDKDGKIIASDLRGEDLINKLGEVLAK